MRSAAGIFTAMDRTTAIVPVVLSGGSGTRLWPLSRRDAPKQLLPLFGDGTMLRATIERLRDLPAKRPPIVVCNAAYADAARAEMERAGEPNGTMIVEPVGRNTAPAVAVAAHRALQEGGDPLLLVMPADHLIADVVGFLEAVEAGADPARDGSLVTFGIKATYPATGYGYIRAPGFDQVRPVAAFVEKPDQETAQRFLATGEYFWNAGMFLFKAQRYLDELARHAPEVAAAAAAAAAHAKEDEPGTVVLDEAAFARSPSISIDYAVMEHTNAAVVVSLDAGWNDIGSWNSILEVSPGDAMGNVLVGNVIVHGSEHSYVRTDGPLIAVAGVSGLVIIATPDAVLVTDRTHSEAVRELVDNIRDTQRPEGEISVRRHRPWGEATLLTRADGTVVDRIDVAGGETLPACTGTWLVLEGTGRHAAGELTAGSTLTVADGEVVAITNSGTHPLVVVAVTSDGV